MSQRAQAQADAPRPPACRGVGPVGLGVEHRRRGLTWEPRLRLAERWKEHGMGWDFLGHGVQSAANTGATSQGPRRAGKEAVTQDAPMGTG